jgi:hypothetical protein
MKPRIIFAVAVTVLLVLACWLFCPRPAPAPAPPELAPAAPAGPATERPLPPGAVRGAPVDPAAVPGVHLPQIHAGPDEVDPERQGGASNLPPGVTRARVAASGKLAHSVIEEYAESFRECYRSHGTTDGELPREALLEFTISADPRDTGDQFGTVSEVQVVTGEADYELMDHQAFERCCVEAVEDLELDPPGGRRGGSMRFGMGIDLDPEEP